MKSQPFIATLGTDPELIQKLKNMHYVDGDGCWHCVGDFKRYARIWYKGKCQLAHRLSYAAFKGEVSPDIKVCHTCDHHYCINPDHLFLGTQKQNLQDMVAKGRHVKADLNGEKCKHNVLTEAQVIEILKDGRSLRKIAKSYGVYWTTIQKLKQNKNWKHIKR